MREGELLFAVQGENFFREVKYTITFSLLDVTQKDKIVQSETLLQVSAFSLAGLLVLLFLLRVDL